jgi:hypothetical protein
MKAFFILHGSIYKTESTILSIRLTRPRVYLIFTAWVCVNLGNPSEHIFFGRHGGINL